MSSLSPNRRVPAGHRARIWAHRAAALAGATVLAATGVTAFSPVGAGAATEPNHCGSSYGLVKSWPIRSQGAEVGAIDVYYSNSTGQNCIVVYPSPAYPQGTFHHITAALSKSGSDDWKWDGTGRNYTYYAGPVYVYAKGSCIDFYGEMRSSGTGAGVGRGSGVVGRVSKSVKRFLESEARVSEYQTNRHCG
ncbi:hypothetical protein ACQPYK_39770 [Streptosporangium sp. CA-135522]|uniref:hypothetical protein n=1 Tax=Streptosporangium sp. CA-135522 TaxID=3240072 RepID=UPI003D8A726D